MTLISPAVDLSNASVFGSREPVSSHFEQQQQGRDAGVGVGGVWQQSGLVNSSSRSSDGFSSSSSSRSGSSRPDMEALIANPAGAAAAGGHSDGSLLSQPQPQQQPDQSPQSAAAAAGGGVTPSPGAAALPLNSSSFRQRPSFTQLPHHQDVDNTSSCQHHHHQQQPHQHVNVAQRQLQQQHVPLEPQPSIECKLHAAHTAGGKLRPLRLMRGLLGEVFTALRVHSSSSSAREVAKSGWFDYLPADSVSDELHCYLKVGMWLVGWLCRLGWRLSACWWTIVNICGAHVSGVLWSQAHVSLFCSVAHPVVSPFPAHTNITHRPATGCELAVTPAGVPHIPPGLFRAVSARHAGGGRGSGVDAT